MTTALLVITDGRPYLQETVRSAARNLLGPIDERWIYDDSGDPNNWDRIREHMPTFRLIVHPEGRQGFGGAIRYAWQFLTRWSRADKIFHLEDDFTFNHPVNLSPMAVLLDRNPHLAQVALRRQPWNDAERAAGGIVELHPDDFQDCHDFELDLRWLEHRRFFTTNPCLYRRALIERGWPDGPESEGRFGLDLVASGASFAYMGARTDPPPVHHIGTERTGNGY